MVTELSTSRMYSCTTSSPATLPVLVISTLTETGAVVFLLSAFIFKGWHNQSWCSLNQNQRVQQSFYSGRLAFIGLRLGL